MYFNLLALLATATTPIAGIPTEASAIITSKGFPANSKYPRHPDFSNY
jgi:hypothetical protein